MIFDGRALARKKEASLKEKLSQLAGQKMPKLISILVGDNPESELYLSLKQKAALRVGIKNEIIRFDQEADPVEIIEHIKRLNLDAETTGIMVQLPLPKGSLFEQYQQDLLNAIDPQKDVDCLTSENLGLLAANCPRFYPAVVKAALEILVFSNTEVSEADVCIVGASVLVGKPLAIVLSSMGATVSLCRKETKDLSFYTKNADILISAAGVAGLIKKEMVKEGAVVIDVGISRQEKKVLGDVEPEVSQKASFFTPVPGGVGPVTVACLLDNLLEVH